MIVKDVIEKLKKLDQDANFFVKYYQEQTENSNGRVVYTSILEENIGQDQLRGTDIVIVDISY
jgi:hypothetical protein